MSEQCAGFLAHDCKRTDPHCCRCDGCTLDGNAKLRDPELQRQMENAAARAEQINAILFPSLAVKS